MPRPEPDGSRPSPVFLLMPPSLTIDLCSYDGRDHVSGPSAWLRRIAQQWRARGHEVRIRLLSWTEAGCGIDEQFLRAAGFSVSSAPVRDTSSNVRWFLDQAAKSPPDLFIANHVVAAHYAAGYLRAAGIPGIGVLHSDDSFYHDLTEQFVFGPSAFRLSGVVGVSRFLTENVAMRDPKLTCSRWIPTGTPIPPVGATPLPRPFRFAYVGRFVEEQKRFRETVEAFILATRAIPGTEAVLFGDGPERTFLEERLRSPDAAAVRWGGSPSPEAISGRLQECHAIVLLSDYEGTPTALMEGMAAGCVPICTRIRSGIPELIEDGVNGILVNDRGPDFVAAIRRLHDDSTLRDRLAAAAHHRIEEDYAIEVCADRWVEFMAELKASAGPRKPLQLPRLLRLPSPLPGFAHQDLRLSPIEDRLRRTYVRSRILAGRVKRKILKI